MISLQHDKRLSNKYICAFCFDFPLFTLPTKMITLQYVHLATLLHKHRIEINARQLCIMINNQEVIVVKNNNKQIKNIKYRTKFWNRHPR